MSAASSPEQAVGRTDSLDQVMLAARPLSPGDRVTPHPLRQTHQEVAAGAGEQLLCFDTGDQTWGVKI